MVENIEGKGENAGYQHFLLFPQFFQHPLPLFRVVKNRDCVVELIGFLTHSHTMTCFDGSGKEAF